MDALALLTAAASFFAAAGVLFNAWQTTRVEARLSSRIDHLSSQMDRLSGRLDSLESTVQTVLTALVQRRGD
ncbi:MAG: hypothetical protein OXH75_08545 [Acidobacteria bacterium]|nr:hypothetical protein [Acidobacteriota bacterium]